MDNTTLLLKEIKMALYIGFSGTRYGMTELQKKAIEKFLTSEELEERIVAVHHGDCVGADAEFHELALKQGFPVFIHPPLKSNYRAFCQSFEYRFPKKEYLARNEDIVKACNLIVIAPNTMQETNRSGTWYTYRYAVDNGKRIILVYPNKVN